MNFHPMTQPRSLTLIQLKYGRWRLGFSLSLWNVENGSGRHETLIPKGIFIDFLLSLSDLSLLCTWITQSNLKRVLIN